MTDEIFVVPGEQLNDLISDSKESKRKIILGPGIRKENNLKLSSKAGLFKFSKEPDTYWIDSFQKRYVAVRGERIIGVVASKGAFNVKVDIGTNDYAILNLLAFEGATKKNKPDINIGDLVYALVLNAGKDIETELVCITNRGKKEGLGVLSQGGYMIQLPIHVVRKILHPDSIFLDNLGIKYKFESAVGLNGRVWIKASNNQNTIALINLFTKLEYSNEHKIIESLNLGCKV